MSDDDRAQGLSEKLDRLWDAWLGFYAFAKDGHSIPEISPEGEIAIGKLGAQITDVRETVRHDLELAARR